MTNDNTVAGRDQFQVWHRSGEAFAPVAFVRTGNLLGATVLTMNRIDAHWQDGEHVTALRPYARSTDIGDVIVSPEGVAYAIERTAHGLVFVPIDFLQYREQQGLSAEWAKDYALARERDVRDLFRADGGGSKPQPEPPSPANDNDRDGGIER